jgi:SAM-dependent methyltransferase
VSDAFEIHAEAYAEKSSTSIHNALYERPALVALLPELLGKDVLDLGCGSGTLIGELLNKGANVTGMDLSAGLIEIARRKFGEKATFHIADLKEDFEFLNGKTFDIIVSSLALHYVEDWNSLFGKIRTHLRDDGYVVFSTHHPSASRTWFDLTNYFERKLVHDVWSIGGQKVIVSNYHRSLTEMFEAFAVNGLFVESLLEPKPLEKAKEISEDTYHRLTNREHFILFRVRVRQ